MRVHKTATSDYYLRHVCLSQSVRLSLRMGQLGSHWKDFHEILYLSIFLKYVMKIQVSLQTNKTNRHCT